MPKGNSAHDQRRPVLLHLLIETRMKAKLTQVELAEAAGVSQPYGIEFDTRSGAHIDTFAPDGRGHFLFDGTEKSVKMITNGFNR